MAIELRIGAKRDSEIRNHAAALGRGLSVRIEICYLCFVNSHVHELFRSGLGLIRGDSPTPDQVVARCRLARAKALGYIGSGNRLRRI